MAITKFGDVTSYTNFVLSNEVEDAYNSHLSLEQFVTVDNDLQGTAGMEKHINKYIPSGVAETVEEGTGNKKKIAVGLDENVYKIALSQAEFEYTDERDMTDPNSIVIGTNHLATALFNDVNSHIYAEFEKATLTSGETGVASSGIFDAFCDAAASIKIVDVNDTASNYLGIALPSLFAFVSKADLATIRKSLKDELKYVVEYATDGYVGSVAGINLYMKQDAKAKEIIVATKKAVTLFNKTGTEVETITKGNRSENYADKRKNLIVARKYYLAALTDATQVYKMTLA